tara:strand:+ start:933 stop:1256 length:324 start_codon:yes stop_codon:yes gene_type:complete
MPCEENNETIDIYEMFGYISGFLFAISLVPQIYKSCKTKKLDDMSYIWQLIFLTGMTLMLIYSYQKDLKPVFIPAAFEAFFMTTLFTMKVYYDLQKRKINNNDIENP